MLLSDDVLVSLVLVTLVRYRPPEIVKKNAVE